MSRASWRFGLVVCLVGLAFTFGYGLAFFTIKPVTNVTYLEICVSLDEVVR